MSDVSLIIPIACYLCAGCDNCFWW